MSSQLEDLYEQHCKSNTASAFHLPTLRRLAEGCELCVEFGCKHGASACALLLGSKRVISVDVVRTPQADRLRDIAGDRWEYRIANTLATDIPECDLLFVDSLHTYKQTRGELARHGHKAKKRIVFHDTMTFGCVGARGETGDQSWHYRPGRSVPFEHLGIRQAIDEFMMMHVDFHIEEAHWESHGLLVLRRL